MARRPRGIPVMFAVNDPRNGMFTGWCDAVSVDDLIQLSGPTEHMVIDDDDDEGENVGTTPFKADFMNGVGTITLGTLEVPARGYHGWMGNWCWDSAWVQRPDLLHLLNYLKTEGWDCCEAEFYLYERWRQPGELRDEDLPS